VDQHHHEFKTHMEGELASYWNQMQGMVNGAYADIQFKGSFSGIAPKIHGIFVKAEEEERVIAMNHNKTIEQNAILVAKAQEMTSYNARLYAAL